MMDNRWSKDQVTGKLVVYFDQMDRFSNDGRYEILRELAGDLITEYAPIYPIIGEYRERLNIM